MWWQFEICICLKILFVGSLGVELQNNSRLVKNMLGFMGLTVHIR